MSPGATSFDVYGEEAGALAEKYESRRFEDIHAGIIDCLPSAPARVLDIGAGSGRDAAWFVNHGYQVSAVEPAKGMREVAQSLHGHCDITWIDDCLPALATLRDQNKQYDLIWLSAMWIHVSPAARQEAFQNPVSLLGPACRIMISLREGPFPPNRIMYATPLDEVEALADAHGLVIMHIADSN